MFFWKPCDWTWDPACEQAVFDKGLAPLSTYSGVLAHVSDDGEKIRVLSLVTRTEIVALSDEEGHVSLAFTNGGDGSIYYFSGPILYKDQYAIPVFKKESPVPGGLLGKEDGGAPFLFEPNFDQVNLWAVAAQGFALTEKRWAWWHSQLAMLSWDNEKGPPAVLFSESKSNPDGSPFGIDNLISAGNWFVSVEVWKETDHLRSVLVFSDGVQKAQPIFPPVPGTSDSSPMFDGENVVWLRGVDHVAGYKYNKIELWAVPFPENPENAQPVKLLDLPEPWHNLDGAYIHGGHGWVAFWTGALPKPDGSKEPIVARLVHVGSRKYKDIALPDWIYRGYMYGFSREHVWFAVDEDAGWKPGRKLIRWRLPSPESLPLRNR
jgi:hypothetical protein